MATKENKKNRNNNEDDGAILIETKKEQKKEILKEQSKSNVGLEIKENNNSLKTEKMDYKVTCYSSGPQSIKLVAGNGSARFMLSNALGYVPGESSITAEFNKEKEVVDLYFTFYHCVTNPRKVTTDDDYQFFKSIDELSAEFEKVEDSNNKNQKKKSVNTNDDKIGKDDKNKKKSTEDIVNKKALSDNLNVEISKKKINNIEEEIDRELYDAYSSGNTFMNFKPAPFSLLRISIPMKYLKMDDLKNYPINICFDNPRVCLFSLPLSKLGEAKFTFTYKYKQQATLNFENFIKRNCDRILAFLFAFLVAFAIMYGYRKIGYITLLKKARINALSDDYIQTYKKNHDGDAPSMDEIDKYISSRKMNVSFKEVCTDKQISKSLGSLEIITDSEEKMAKLDKKMEEIARANAEVLKEIKADNSTENQDESYEEEEKLSEEKKLYYENLKEKRAKKEKVENELKELMLEKYRLKIYASLGIPGTSFGEKCMCLVAKYTDDFIALVVGQKNKKMYTKSIDTFLDYISAALLGFSLYSIILTVTRDYKEEKLYKLNKKEGFVLAVIIVKYIWHLQQVLDGPSRNIMFLMIYISTLLLNRDTAGAMPTISLIAHIIIGMAFYPLITIGFVAGVSCTYFTKSIINKRQFIEITTILTVYPVLLHLFAKYIVRSYDLENSSSILYIYKMLVGIKDYQESNLKTDGAEIKFGSFLTKKGLKIIMGYFRILAPMGVACGMHILTIIINKIKLVKKKAIKLENVANIKSTNDEKKKPNEIKEIDIKEKNKDIKLKEKSISEPKKETIEKKEYQVVDDSIMQSGAILWMALSSGLSLCLLRKNAYNSIISMYLGTIAIYIEKCTQAFVDSLKMIINKEDKFFIILMKRLYNYALIACQVACVIVFLSFDFQPKQKNK